MRNLPAAILGLIYLVFSTGVSLRLHYCMGELQSAELNEVRPAGKECPTCGMQDRRGCCDDRARLVKLTREYDLQRIESGVIGAAVRPHPLPAWLFVPLPIRPFCVCRANGSPPVGGQLPLYKRNRDFRI